MQRLPDRVDLYVADQVLEQIVAADQQAHGDRVYDLSGCERFDSSLLALLFELMRRAAADGVRCRFEGASPNMLKLASLYGTRALLFGPAAGRAAGAAA